MVIPIYVLHATMHIVVYHSDGVSTLFHLLSALAWTITGWKLGILRAKGLGCLVGLLGGESTGDPTSLAWDNVYQSPILY